jgi:hypothetical protein
LKAPEIVGISLVDGRLQHTKAHGTTSSESSVR